ncbi:Dehydrogenase [Bacillus thermotolerans]|nr:Dehydrogenase [Bacillus thermotolerans]
MGWLTVQSFADKGAKVVIGDFNEEGGKQVEQELKNQGKDVQFIKVDAGDEDSVASMVKETAEHYGQVDIIVNNAGIGILGETHEMSYEDYQKVIKVNQDGVFFGMKHAIREMLKTGGGVIVNTASILGSVGEAGALPYNASKGAVNLMINNEVSSTAIC